MSELGSEMAAGMTEFADLLRAVNTGEVWGFPPGSVRIRDVTRRPLRRVGRMAIHLVGRNVVDWTLEITPG